MSLSEQARELAGKIDKATPKRFMRMVSSQGYYELVSDPYPIDREYKGINVDHVPDETVEAIVAARNEAPDLLRQLVDENERLRRVVDQVMDAGGFYIDNECIRDIENEFFAPVKDALDLAEEIQQREAQ